MIILIFIFFITVTYLALARRNFAPIIGIKSAVIQHRHRHKWLCSDYQAHLRGLGFLRRNPPRQWRTATGRPQGGSNNRHGGVVYLNYSNWTPIRAFQSCYYTFSKFLGGGFGRGTFSKKSPSQRYFPKINQSHSHLRKYRKRCWFCHSRDWAMRAWSKGDLFFFGAGMVGGEVRPGGRRI